MWVIGKYLCPQFSHLRDEHGKKTVKETTQSTKGHRWSFMDPDAVPFTTDAIAISRRKIKHALEAVDGGTLAISPPVTAQPGQHLVFV